MTLIARPQGARRVANMKTISACVCLWFVCACSAHGTECLDRKVGCIVSEPTLKSDAGDPAAERLDAAAQPGDTGTSQDPNVTVPVGSPDAAAARGEADDDAGAQPP